MKNSDRIKISPDTELNLASAPKDIVKKLDQMCKSEIPGGMTRPSMVRIAISEAWDKRYGKKKSKKK